jgi:sterol desaturase/sphingolipid hydroxylase (fatty acid hydroxylase superfamily)
MANIKPNEHVKLQVIFHTIGISCVAGAVFLQALVFMSIASQGVFMGIESNQFVLFAEIVVTIFCITYFIYLAISKILSILGLRKQQ